MNVGIKLIFVLLATAGIISIFYVSWFWRALIGPMVAILLIDVISSFFKKEKKK